MSSDYLFVVQDKNKNIINSTQFSCDFDYAKMLLGILMYQTGVRYGYVLEKVQDILGNISFSRQVYDSVIVHEGE